jgi:hypothetical protein
MKKKVLVWGGYSTLIVILLIVNFFAGQALARPETTRAKEEVNEPIPNHPDAPSANFYCSSVNNVAAFENRVHLRCSNSNGGIIYYAYATDPAHVATANQILAIANTAFALGKGVWVYYNSSSTLNPPGCNTGDCRGLIGVSMIQ